MSTCTALSPNLLASQIAAREIDPASLIIEPIADPTARLLGPQPNEP